MTKPASIFIFSFALLIPLVMLLETLSPATQLIYCMPFILLIGIPHGAIDNILYSDKKGFSQGKFIIGYLIIIGINVGFWLLLPDLAYISFLLLSAYHFGQSQFSHHVNNEAWLSKMLYLIWGIALLSGLIYFNLAEVQQIAATYPDFSIFTTVHIPSLLKGFLTGTLVLTLIILAILTAKKIISVKILVAEVILLSLIMMSFYLMPLLIGFTIYFVVLHSYKVLQEEFAFLKTQNTVANLKSFITLLAPFTLFSIFGIALLVVASAQGIIHLSYGYIFLIAISSITLPHAFVMNRFYNIFYVHQ